MTILAMPSSIEFYGDIVTLLALAIVFMMLTYYALIRVHEWDSLGRALTFMSAALSALFFFAVFRIFFGDGSPVWRWVLRALTLIGAAGVGIHLHYDGRQEPRWVQWVDAVIIRAGEGIGVVVFAVRERLKGQTDAPSRDR